MIEIRQTKGQNLGLYTTTALKSGDVVLEEIPLFTFSPKTDEQVDAIQSQFKEYDNIDTSQLKNGSKLKAATSAKSKNDDLEENDPSPMQTCLDKLIFPNIPKDKSDKFRSMIIAASSYALFRSSDKQLKSKVFDLYFPSSSSSLSSSEDGHEHTTNSTTNDNMHEKPILDLSQQAVKFLQTATKTSGTIHRFCSESPKECQDIMLVWACNAFEGGRVYETASRINHSCDFNCVASNTPTNGKSENEKQTFRAVCDIEPGTEITISYLGSWVFSDYMYRNSILEKDKYFHCSCERCCKEDVAAAIPCPSCHFRAGSYLDEDVQYDDDNDVQYATPQYRVTDDIKEKGSRLLGWKCPSTKTDTKYNTKEQKWIIAYEKAQDKIKKYFDDTEKNFSDDDQEEMLERMHYLSLSVLGGKHWCTNLLGVSKLGKQLEYIHSAMLCTSTGQKQKVNNDEDNPLSEENIAECIDSLQRLWKFVEDLNMKCHPAHLLGSLTVGVARALVGLGDLGSMKYGAKWAEKVDEDYYLKGFEGESMAKVVRALRDAWKRKEGIDDGSDKPNKKAKLSS